MIDLLRDLLFVFWVFIPAGIANMAPVFAAHIPAFKRFNQPMDFDRTFRGRRILGDHKTWRGLVSGIVAATFVLALQQVLVQQYGWFAWLANGLNYEQLPTLLVGPLFALGALGGDAVKSFFKRQIGVAPGKRWFPFDQIDYIIGGALAVLPFVHFTIRQYCMLVIFWTIAVMITTYIGWLLKLKDQPI